MIKKQSQQQRKKGKKGGKSTFTREKFHLLGVTKEANDYLTDVKLLKKNFRVG